jgi:hypothetical protein
MIMVEDCDTAGGACSNLVHVTILGFLGSRFQRWQIFSRLNNAHALIRVAKRIVTI